MVSFFTASRNGDLERLRSLLAADITAYADGGGKIPASEHPVVGLADVMELHASLATLFAEKMSRLLCYGFINGLPGFITIEQDNILQTTALQIENDKISVIYVTRNPDKLRHLGDRRPELDVDLTEEIISQPERFPLQVK